MNVPFAVRIVDGERYVLAADVEDRIDDLECALWRIATPRRPDGIYNLSRQACEQLAREALKEPDFQPDQKG